MPDLRRWSVGELLVGAWFLVSLLILWWGTAFLRGGAPFWFFLAALFSTVTAFAVFHVVEGTSRNLGRLLLVAGFSPAIPLALGDAGLIGFGVVAFAALFTETAILRVNRFRHMLRYVRTLTLARSLIPSYFSALSFIFAAIVLFSPIGTTVLENPLPEGILRRAFQFVDLSPSVLPPQLDLRNPAIREQFGAAIGVALDPDDDFAALLSKVTARETKRLAQTHGDVFRFGFYITALGVFRVFAVPLTWLTMPFVFFALRILRAARRVAAVEEPTVRTVLKWE